MKQPGKRMRTGVMLSRARSPRKRGDKGFTLVELSMAMLIMGILLTMIVRDDGPFIHPDAPGRGHQGLF